MSPKKLSKPLDLYVRVSSVRGREGESFQSPALQEERCRALALAKGYPVGEVFTDLDASGGVMNRPAFNQALQRIRDGKSSGIIVARLDRFARTLQGALDVIEEIDKAGGYLIECDGDWDTSTSMGRFGRDLVLRLAQLYREQIAETWQASKRGAVARGVHIARHAPPGYRKGEGGRLEPHPRHAATVRKGFEMAASGSGPAAIAALFTQRELPSGDTLKPIWRSNRIGRLLANRVYLGEARGSGEIVNPDAHTALVDPTTWALAQRTPTATPVKPGAKYLLAGLVRCASCRSALRGQVPGKTSAATYRCPGETVSGRCPHPSSITMARLDEIVYEAYCERVFAKETPERETQDDSAALAALEDARGEVAEVEALHDRGELGPVAYGKALEAALADVEAAEKELTSRQARFVAVSAADMTAAMALHEENMARLLAGESVSSVLLQPGPGWDLLRHMLASEIQVVFVRPPVRRSKSIPVADRVKIIWRDEAEELELPIRGTSRVFEPYVWEAA